MSLKSAIKKGMGNPNCGIRVLLGPDGPSSTFFLLRMRRADRDSGFLKHKLISKRGRLPGADSLGAAPFHLLMAGRILYGIVLMDILL